jgi:hypothetical protein
MCPHSKTLKTILLDLTPTLSCKEREPYACSNVFPYPCLRGDGKIRALDAFR